jgi:tol-pal system protein YbgF
LAVIRLSRFGAALLLIASAAAPAHGQLFGDNEARKAILDLRTKVAELEKQLTEKDAALAARLDRIEPAQRGQLELANQLEQLKAELAKLRGQIDQLTNELAQQQKRSRDLYTDLDTRLKKLEPTSVTLDGRAATIERSEQAAYDAAIGQFRAGDFRGAVQSFQVFLARYPNSAYAALAQYWLGNSHYQLKDYKAAIAAQRIVVDRHADSPRAPDALLNIAASQVELNDRNGARSTLQRVVKDYPDSEAAGAARDRLKSLGAK